MTQKGSRILPFLPDPKIYSGVKLINPDNVITDMFNTMDRINMSSSGQDNQFFAKNVTYDNAFDYYDSPNYGLRTSEIAYNMSMEDELNTIVEGLADPNSQMVLNTQTAQQDSDNQIEYSAIAVRGNPLKTGTYISPYSV